jgi:HEPN domain-containing protein
MRPQPVMRREFQRLADLRAEEARILVRARKQQGAYYLAGYAVECALKACIAKQTKRHEFPPGSDYIRHIYTHNLEQLLREAGLDKQLDNDMRANAELAKNWNAVKVWDEGKRYVISGLSGKDMVLALSGLNGVLTWLKKHW